MNSVEIWACLEQSAAAVATAAQGTVLHRCSFAAASRSEQAE